MFPLLPGDSCDSSPLPARRPASGRRALRAPVPASALDVLASAYHDLVEATATRVPVERYAAAHRAALHAAAAVLAVRARPDTTSSRRRGPRSAWALLARVAPELGEWAAFFAAGAGKRAAAEAGLTRVVSARDADDLLRDAQTFLALAETTLGIDSLDSRVAPPRLAPRAS